MWHHFTVVVWSNGWTRWRLVREDGDNERTWLPGEMFISWNVYIYLFCVERVFLLDNFGCFCLHRIVSCERIPIVMLFCSRFTVAVRLRVETTTMTVRLFARLFWFVIYYDISLSQYFLLPSIVFWYCSYDRRVGSRLVPGQCLLRLVKTVKTALT